MRDIVNENSFLRLARSIFRILLLIIRSTVKSMAWSSGMLVNKLQTSNDRRKFWLQLRFLISRTNENESLTQYFFGMSGMRIELRYFAKL